VAATRAKCRQHDRGPRPLERVDKPFHGCNANVGDVDGPNQEASGPYAFKGGQRQPEGADLLGFGIEVFDHEALVTGDLGPYPARVRP
jgi:hypothetical protein